MLDALYRLGECPPYDWSGMGSLLDATRAETAQLGRPNNTPDTPTEKRKSARRNSEPAVVPIRLRESKPGGQKPSYGITVPVEDPGHGDK